MKLVIEITYDQFTQEQAKEWANHGAFAELTHNERAAFLSGHPVKVQLDPSANNGWPGRAVHRLVLEEKDVCGSKEI